VSAADGVALVILAGLVAYALLGGADFGGGVWDLLARGPRRERHRELIARTMGPVWEANHVWLVFVLIGLFSGFPAAFGALSRSLAVPLMVALLGIVLRGAAFVYRQYGAPGAGAWGVVFAVASTVTPLTFGLAAGMLATGLRLDAFAVVAGLFALAACAYLAAVYLCREAGADRDLADDFRRRALGAAVCCGVLAAAGVPALVVDAPALADRLLGRGLPAVLLSAGGGAASIGLLAARRYLAARLAGGAAVAGVLAGWALAQYPDLVPGLYTVDSAAVPPNVMRVTLSVLLVGFAVTVPSLVLLLRVFGPSDLFVGEHHPQHEVHHELRAGKQAGHHEEQPHHPGGHPEPAGET